MGIDSDEKEIINSYAGNFFKSVSKSFLFFIPFFLLLLFKDFNSYSLLITLSIGIGFVLSLLIVNEGLGTESKFVTNFCNFNSSVSCDKVIVSPQSKINNWLSFSDLPIIFYSSCFISLFALFETAVFIGFSSIFSFPIVIYSLWLQKFKLKKWCPLCLLVSLNLVILGILFLIFSSKIYLTLDSLFVFLLSIAASSLLWFTIKKSLELSKIQQNEIYQLRKIKRSFSVFNNLSKPILEIDKYNKLQKLSFGEPNVPIKITLILSPACFHCHKAFKDAIKLMNSYADKIYIEILFNINRNNKENPFIPVVETLAEMKISNSEKLFEAINDWHSQKLDLKAWQRKWMNSTISETSTILINEHYDWCLLNNFNYTPVLIINQKLFPKEYGLEDLNYFISDLVDQNSNENMLNSQFA